ncbi:unnamed protein product, partial [Chrysoparadoxa australica]
MEYASLCHTRPRLPKLQLAEVDDESGHHEEHPQEPSRAGLRYADLIAKRASEVVWEPESLSLRKVSPEGMEEAKKKKRRREKSLPKQHALESINPAEGTRCYQLNLHFCRLDRLLGLPEGPGASPWSAAQGSDEEEERQDKSPSSWLCLELDVSLNSFRSLLQLRAPAFDGIVTLDVSNNLLVNLDGIGAWPQLQHLWCSSNVLNSTEGLRELLEDSALRHLDLSGNRLTTENSLGGLYASGMGLLLTLNLGCNALTALPHGMAASLRSLQMLNLAGNRLKALAPLAGIKSLQQLDCTTNNLHDLMDLQKTLANLGGLVSLRGWDNPLASNPKYTIAAAVNCPSLQELD